MTWMADSNSFDNIDETAGTILFTSHGESLFDASKDVMFFEFQKNNSMFSLTRNKNLDLVFVHWNTKTGIREAKISMKDFNPATELLIGITWSEKENRLDVGEVGTQNAKCVVATQKGGTVRKGVNGALYQIGDTGVVIPTFQVREGGKDVLLPMAKEVWDFTITKVNVLINGCKLGDFLFQSILVQQCVVMLVTGFEVYTKNRFIEMEKEGKKPNLEALLNEFAKKDETRKEIEDYAKQPGKNIFAALVELRGRGLINFQEWDKCKAAYNKSYHIKFGEIPELRPEIIPRIQKYATWRHKIIHSKKDMTVLNADNVPPEQPTFATKEFIESARDDFIEFIEKLHKMTI